MKQLFCEKCTRFLADRLEKTELFLRKTRQVLDRSIFFKCNGIEEPLFYYLHHNSQYLIIIFVLNEFVRKFLKLLVDLVDCGKNEIKLEMNKTVLKPSCGGLEVERVLHNRRDSALVGSNPV